MKKAFILFMAFVLIACTSEPDAKRALHGAGFTDIKITGYRMFGCGDSDLFHTGFIAKNVHGESIEGVVCSSMLKSATVRF